MITQEVKNTLFLFKRIHTKQLKPHEQLLTPELESQIKRKKMRTMTDRDIQRLAKRILKTINQYQKNRDKPHAGLDKFSITLHNLLS